MSADQKASFAGRAPYSLALGFVSRSLKLFVDPAVRVWPRNSFVLGHFRPFQSDLDLTLFFENGLDRKKAKKLRSVLSWSKTLFPFLGEANVYEPRTLGLIDDLINPWELRRDPKLLEVLGQGEKRAFSAHYAASFLLRMLESDAHNLLTRPGKRARKWATHLRDVRNCLPDRSERIPATLDPARSIESILEEVFFLAEIDDPACRVDARAWVELYFELSSRKVQSDRMGVIFSARPWWQSFFPHRFCFQENILPMLDHALTGVCVGQLEWELFGMVAQFPLQVNNSKILSHIDTLETFVRRSAALSPARPFVKIEKLISRVRQVVEEFPE